MVPDYYGCFDNWRFRKYELTVNAGHGFHFIGEPWINLVNHDQLSAEAFVWNNFPAAHDRFFITQKNPDQITAVCWAGSHSMIINLACQVSNE
jgi:hypothetical protein